MLTFLFAFFFLFSFSPALAGNNVTVTCDSTDCSVSPALPIFYETNIYPGYSVSQTVTFANRRDDACDLVMTTKADEANSSILAEKITITIDGTPHLLTDLFTQTISLGTLAAASQRQSPWVSTFDVSADNRYQNLRQVFDVDFNFTCAPASFEVILNEIMANPPSGDEWVEIRNPNNFSITLSEWQIDDIASGGCASRPLNATIPANGFYVYHYSSSCLNNDGDTVRLINNFGVEVDTRSYASATTAYSYSRQSDSSWCNAVSTENSANNACYVVPSNGGDGGGGVGGASTSQVCSDSKPASPANLTATVLANSDVLLNWNHVPQYSSYLVAYGLAPGVYLYGNPNVGSSNTYTVGSLVPGARYCFVVRAQNGCTPGDFSNEVCVNAASTIVVPTGSPAPGFTEEVLGEETTTPPVSEVAGEIAGSTDLCSRRWLPILFLLAGIINFLYFRSFGRHAVSALPFIISLLALVIDSILMKNRCCLVANWFCRLTWLWSLLSFLLPAVWRRKN